MMTLNPQPPSLLFECQDYRYLPPHLAYVMHVIKPRVCACYASCLPSEPHHNSPLLFCCNPNCMIPTVFSNGMVGFPLLPRIFLIGNFIPFFLHFSKNIWPLRTVVGQIQPVSSIWPRICFGEPEH